MDADESQLSFIQQILKDQADTNEDAENTEPILQIDPLQLYFGEDYKINDKIKIRQPTIGDFIKYGERNIDFTIIPFVSNSTTYRVDLWDMGIDWTKIDDYEFFIMSLSLINPEYTHVIFGDIDFTGFKIAITEENGEEIKTLINPIQDIEIDKITYLKMAKYIQFMFNTFPKTEIIKGKNNKLEQIWLEKKERNSKHSDFKSNLLPMISFCLNHPGFKYKKDELKNVGIVEFMDSVKRLQVYESTNALLKGAYSGFLDTKKINKDEFNFMRDIVVSA